jgi:hypothetical protein
MESPVLEIAQFSAQDFPLSDDWMPALEAGRLLYFPRMAFALSAVEQKLLRPDIRAPRSRNISLSPGNRLQGAACNPDEQIALADMLLRFRGQAEQLVQALFPQYRGKLRMGNGSFRPAEVAGRAQSLRADDRLLHVDAFPSRPNRGERILRVFCNANPSGVPRLWRLGEPFETLARRFLPRAKPYSSWQAGLLLKMGITKSLRSEYDHLMLQLHDGMKRDGGYQQYGRQVSMAFAPGSTWVCFSDQVAHAATSGQYMLEQTLHLPAHSQGEPEASPLAILGRIQGHALV